MNSAGAIPPPLTDDKKMEILSKIYFAIGEGGNFANERALLYAAKKVNASVTLKDVRRFLRNSYVYLRHKKRPSATTGKKKRGKDRLWMPTVPGQIVHIDLFYLSDSRFKCYLVVVDLFSGYTAVRALMSKKPEVVARAFEDMLRRKQFPFPVWTVSSDRGSEFIGKPFQDKMRELGIRFAVSQSRRNKAFAAEERIKDIRLKRAQNQTLTGKTEEHMVQDAVNTLNNTVVPEIGLSPSEITEANSGLVFQRKYSKYLRRLWGAIDQIKPRFKRGDAVRLADVKLSGGDGVPEKKIRPGTFSAEVYLISEVHRNSRTPQYSLVDFQARPIHGRIAESQLVKAEDNHSDHRRIEWIKKADGDNNYIKFRGIAEPILIGREENLDKYRKLFNNKRSDADHDED